MPIGDLLPLGRHGGGSLFQTWETLEKGGVERLGILEPTDRVRKPAEVRRERWSTNLVPDQLPAGSSSPSVDCLRMTTARFLVVDSPNIANSIQYV